MDECVEAGEKQRFYLDAQCSRWKRQYQSCLLESKLVPSSGAAEFCAQQLARLTDCVRVACVRRPQQPAPAAGGGG